MDNHSAPPADGLQPQPPLGSVHTCTFPALLNELGISSVDPGDSVSGTVVPTLHGVFLASPAPQDTQVVGPVVVFNDPVFFDTEASQLRDRHGHGIRLQLQELYLATGHMVVVLSGSGGQLNWHELVAGEYVLTIDGRRVFDCFGRGPLGGVQKVRSFPVVGVLETGSLLAGAVTAVGGRSPS
jgi:hypothetical protein